MLILKSKTTSRERGRGCNSEKTAQVPETCTQIRWAWKNSSISWHSTLLHWILLILSPCWQYSRSFSFLHSFFACLSPIKLINVNDTIYNLKVYIYRNVFVLRRRISNIKLLTCAWADKFSTYFWPWMLSNVTKSFHLLPKTLASFCNSKTIRHLLCFVCFKSTCYTNF